MECFNGIEKFNEIKDENIKQLLRILIFSDFLTIQQLIILKYSHSEALFKNYIILTIFEFH